MYVVLFRSPPTQTTSYPFVLALSFALGTWIAARRARTRAINQALVLRPSIYIAAVSFLGGYANERKHFI
jgi:prolipoprotein diacylglyceryltransferase